MQETSVVPLPAFNSLLLAGGGESFKDQRKIKSLQIKQLTVNTTMYISIAYVIEAHYYGKKKECIDRYRLHVENSP